MSDEFKIKNEMIEICRRLHTKNLLAAADGNLSYRISDQRILITPSGLSKAFMKSEDMAEVTLEGKVLKGKPSSELSMHLEVLKSCPKAKAVLHAHPPTAIAWSIAHPDLSELPNDCISELILAVGRVPIIPYARPGTPEMGHALREYLPDHRAMILSKHGALSWGEDLMEAFFGIERLEHSAEVLYRAVQLGGLNRLPDGEIEVLKNLRSKIGDRTL